MDQKNKRINYNCSKFCLSLSLVIITLTGLGNSSNQESTDINAQDIVDWNEVAYRIAYEHDQFYSLIGIRALTMVHLAIHDALNSIIPKYEHYAYHENAPAANATVAVSQAAFEILITQYPERRDTLEMVLKAKLNDLDASPAKQKAIQLGKKASQRYIQIRHDDGHQKQGNYTPMSKPGDYQYTPGWDNWVLKPDFNYAVPFAMDTVTQFRSPPPPQLVSGTYTSSYNEVKKLGCKNSSYRTNDETYYAHWWAEFAEHSWNRIGRIAVQEKKLSVWEAARMFALINMDIYDIYLASLESKYFYDTWRPITAVHQANEDGNVQTVADAHWEPEMLTPPWPEYPSAHAAVGAGGAEIMTHLLGNSKFSFSMESTSALSNAKTRSFYDLREAAKECAESRIMNGYHFRFATEEGMRQGKKIAHFICSNYLRPIDPP